MGASADQGAGGRVSDISSSHWLESAEVIMDNGCFVGRAHNGGV
jgi:hypothetical protein